jgi:hypothetical protein
MHAEMKQLCTIGSFASVTATATTSSSNNNNAVVDNGGWQCHRCDNINLQNKS